MVFRSNMLVPVQGSLQDGQVFAAAQPAHALLGLDHGADRPALDHPDIPPMTNVVAKLANPADWIFDLIGLTRPATIIGQAQAHACHHVVHALADCANNAIGLLIQPIRQGLEQLLAGSFAFDLEGLAQRLAGVGASRRRQPFENAACVVNLAALDQG